MLNLFLFFSKSAAKLKMDYFVKCFDVYTWTSILLTVILLTSLLQTHCQSNRSFPLESICAPLVEISPPNLELKKSSLQFVFALWMLTCLFLTNFYKMFLTESTVLPLANNPPDKWSEIFDNFYSIYSFMENTVSVRFEYEKKTLKMSPPRSLFEKSPCNMFPTVQYFTAFEGDSVPYCEAGIHILYRGRNLSVSLEQTDVKDIITYNNLKVISEAEHHVGSGRDGSIERFTFKRPKEELKVAEKLLADCNGAVLVETEEAFKSFILETLPK